MEKKPSSLARFSICIRLIVLSVLCCSICLVNTRGCISKVLTTTSPSLRPGLIATAFTPVEVNCPRLLLCIIVSVPVGSVSYLGSRCLLPLLGIILPISKLMVERLYNPNGALAGKKRMLQTRNSSHGTDAPIFAIGIWVKSYINLLLRNFGFLISFHIKK